MYYAYYCTKHEFGFLVYEDLHYEPPPNRVARSAWRCCDDESTPCHITPRGWVIYDCAAQAVMVNALRSDWTTGYCPPDTHTTRIYRNGGFSCFGMEPALADFLRAREEARYAASDAAASDAAASDAAASDAAASDAAAQ